MERENAPIRRQRGGDTAVTCIYAKGVDGWKEMTRHKGIEREENDRTRQTDRSV